MLDVDVVINPDYTFYAHRIFCTFVLISFLHSSSSGNKNIGMEVIIELSPETAHQLQRRDQSMPLIDQLTTTIDSLNVIIKPQYRGEDDTTSNYFFVIEAKDWDECQRVAMVFGQLPVVKAAYCKPEVELAFLP